MNIGQLIAERGKPFYSLEFFPPKDPDQWPDFFKMAERLAPLEPLFTSVTYGAGGSSQDATLEIVSHLKKEFQFETMAHLTCVGATQDYITQYLQRLRDNGVDNVLALRGEINISSPTFLRLSLHPSRAAFIAAPKALKSYRGTGLFAIVIHPITFYCSPFFLDMST